MSNFGINKCLVFKNSWKVMELPVILILGLVIGGTLSAVDGDLIGFFLAFTEPTLGQIFLLIIYLALSLVMFVKYSTTVIVEADSIKRCLIFGFFGTREYKRDEVKVVVNTSGNTLYINFEFKDGKSASYKRKKNNLFKEEIIFLNNQEVNRP